MGFGQAVANFRKHGIRFGPEAQGVFDDDFAITIIDDSDPAERRFITLGMGTKAKLLVVADTYRGENIRIISAGPAEPRECQQYEEQR